MQTDDVFRQAVANARELAYCVERGVRIAADPLSYPDALDVTARGLEADAELAALADQQERDWSVDQ